MCIIITLHVIWFHVIMHIIAIETVLLAITVTVGSKFIRKAGGMVETGGGAKHRRWSYRQSTGPVSI